MIPKKGRVLFWARWGDIVPYQKIVYKGRVLVRIPLKPNGDSVAKPIRFP
jgi:hypothetical protein